MADRFIDFDAARAERTKEPLRLRAYGQDFELPASMPASLFLDIVRLGEENDGSAQVSNRDAVALLRRVLPASVLDALLAQDGFYLDDFTDLAQLIIKAYTRKDDSGEAPAPNRATRRKASQTR